MSRWGAVKKRNAARGAVDLPDGHREDGMQCFAVTLDVLVRAEPSGTRRHRRVYIVTRLEPAHAASAAQKLVESGYHVMDVVIVEVRLLHPAGIHPEGADPMGAPS